MYKGTTPTFTLTLPEGTDLTLASHVYVTFASAKKTLFTKSGDELEISGEGNAVNVYLDQEETLGLPAQVFIQINWTYTEAGAKKRACSTVKRVSVSENLCREVLD